MKSYDIFNEEKFLLFTKTHPTLLYPVIAFQKIFRSKTFGKMKWNTFIQRRQSVPSHEIERIFAEINPTYFGEKNHGQHAAIDINNFHKSIDSARNGTIQRIAAEQHIKENVQHKEQNTSFMSFDATSAKYLSARTQGNSHAAASTSGVSGEDKPSRRKTLGDSASGTDVKSALGQ